MASAIDRLNSDNELRERLALAAPGSVRHLALPAIVEQWNELLEGLSGP